MNPDPGLTASPARSPGALEAIAPSPVGGRSSVPGASWVALVVALAVALPATAQSTLQVARSADGVAVAAHPLAAAAGARMLELGGNAADAAVAAGFAIAVVEPSMNSIGGRNQILVRTPDGTVRAIDGTTVVPLGYDPATAPRAAYGYATIGVPGAVAGLLRLHAEYATLPLSVVMAPAIEYAERGFRLLPGEAAREAAAAPQIRESPGASLYYLRPDGTPYRPGDLLVQTDLGRTLRALAAGGADAFYRGEIAGRIADDMAAHGGFVTLEALAAYEAEDARVVRGTYRGYEIVGPDMPASGALAIEALQIAETFDPDALGPEVWASVLAQSLALALEDYRRLGPDSVARRVTSKAWARSQADRIRVPAGTAGGSGEAGLDETGALHPPLPDGGHTTHLSTVDANGMAVALTQTLGPNMGSKVATPGLGFLYAVTLGGYLGVSEPGERARSGITPFMVLENGEPRLVLGAAGGIRILSAVIQTVSRVIDDGMSLPEALAAPRVHPDVDTQGGDLRLSLETNEDDGWSGDAIETFETLGFELVPIRFRGAFGRVHGIQYDPERGLWIGAADPDWEGAAIAPRAPSSR